jgi:mono/diheme cytochrome c family protein
MNSLNRRCIVSFGALLVAVAGFSLARAKQVEKTTIKSTSPASAQQMYMEYCAVCHGRNGKGAGPAAPELKTPPPDLTTLAKRHNRKFPDVYVVGVLKSGTKAPAHGSSDMPIWGPLFKSLNSHDEAIVEQRITNLTRYVEKLQVK